MCCSSEEEQEDTETETIAGDEIVGAYGLKEFSQGLRTLFCLPVSQPVVECDGREISSSNIKLGEILCKA